MALLVSFLPGGIFNNQKASASLYTAGPETAAASGDCVNDSSVGTTAWSNPGNAFSTNNSYATATLGNSGNSQYVKCTNFGFSIPTGSTISGFIVEVERKASVTGVSHIQDEAVRLVKGGTIGSTDRSTATNWPTTDAYESHGDSQDLWGTSWSASDINASNFGTALRAGNHNAATITASVDEMRITVYYTASAQINQNGYIWENDDEDQAGGDAYNENSQQVAGNTALTGVRKGERLTLRAQIENIGSGPVNAPLGLFYDKNGDNNFRQVTHPRPIPSAGSGCNASGWTCTDVHSTGTSGTHADLFIDANGRPVAGYLGTGGITYAEYVGSGGNCNDAAWNCTVVDSAGGGDVTFTVGPNGERAFIYYRASNASWGAVYVGTGGDCTDARWDCALINDGNGISPLLTDIAINSEGTVSKMAKTDSGASSKLRFCVGTVTSTCFEGGGATEMVGITTEEATSLDFAPDVAATRIAYFNSSSSDLIYAEHVGTGGGCNESAWNCTTVDSSGTTGDYPSLEYSPSGVPYISYYDSTAGQLNIAQYVTSGGSGCASSAWTCTAIQTVSAQHTQLAFSPQGKPYIAYYDSSGGDLELAYLVGGGAGNCTNTDWQCTSIETTNDVGSYASISFGANGQPWIGYYNVTNSAFRVATFPGGDGEISLANAVGAVNGDSITESHADMTSVTNTSNRDDADCISGAWANGKYFSMDENSNLGLPGGSCTEVAFTIDTSQAVTSATYRFIVATTESYDTARGKWRGPVSVAQYATMTIASDTDFKASKGFESQGGSCTSSAWTCTAIETTNDVGGSYDSIAFGPTGVPYISYRDTTNSGLRLAQFVGSGGSGCASSAWTCAAVDSTNDVGGDSSIAFSPAGVPYISYRDATNTGLRVAQYVGSGGSGCSNAAWTCTAIETTNDVGTNKTSIAFSPSGVPYISYFDNTNTGLRVAQYVGSGGSGCASTAWTCTGIESTNDVGSDSSIAFSPAGVPYISYLDFTNTGLRLAQYVGSGGTGCNSTAWLCTAVDSTNNVGYKTSLAFGPSGVPYISYHDFGNTGLRVAQYVGSGGSGCSNTAWTCTAIETTNDVGDYTSLAFSPTGVPYISYRDTTNTGLRLAQYVTSGGSGCASSAWTCTDIDSSNDVGNYSNLAFSPSGVPYISYYDATNTGIRVAKLSLYEGKPIYSAPITNPVRSARWGNNIYSFADGRSPRSNAVGACGSGTLMYIGICGLFDDGGHVDSVTALATERPVFNFSQRFSTNTNNPTIVWAGMSSVTPSTGGTAGDIKLQVYRFGSTNAWVDIATNSTATNCDTGSCRVSGNLGGTLSEFYEADGGNYWMHLRVWQYENTSAAETLRTDLLQFLYSNTQMRGGKIFENNVKRPHTF